MNILIKERNLILVICPSPNTVTLIERSSAEWRMDLNFRLLSSFDKFCLNSGPLTRHKAYL